MVEFNASTLYKVEIIESERGYGQKKIETKVFPSYKAAKSFVDDFNKDNIGDTVPDWYMVALGPYKLVS